MNETGIFEVESAGLARAEDVNSEHSRAVPRVGGVPFLPLQTLYLNFAVDIFLAIGLGLGAAGAVGGVYLDTPRVARDPGGRAVRSATLAPRSLAPARDDINLRALPLEHLLARLDADR